MKKLFILLTSMFAVSLLSMAQVKLFVHQNDGSYTEFIAASVDSITFSEQKEGTNPDNGYQWVDMGLPSGLLWATCNIGANKPTEFGDYYAWGETETKSSFAWSTYKWYAITNNEILTKYNTHAGRGDVDNKTLLELSDDAANVKLGGNWRMPTQTEFKELMNPEYCTWCYIAKDGVLGYLVVSKKNGNSIFMPLWTVNKSGQYWSSTLSNDYPTNASMLFFAESYRALEGTSRSNGNTIRPVLAKTLDYTIHFDANGAEGEMADIDVKYAETFTMPNSLFTHCEQFRGWNTMADGSGTSYKVNQKITIIEDLTLYAMWGSKYSHVDLGLPSGILWATCNIGAEKPEEYGDYFAWGEVEPLDDTYKWNSDYKYGDRCSNVRFELVDDAARHNWEENWRVPTDTEIKELINECTWTWTTLNDVAGYEVKGPNGNTIFLPAAGGEYWTSQGIRAYSQGKSGYYRGNLKACQSFTTMFGDGYVNAFMEMDQNNGFTIRPVRNKTIEIYKLSFEANDGEGKMDTLKLEYAEYKILPTTAFKRNGYRFASWNTKADGTGVAYTNLSQITLTEDVTLYAQWEEVVGDNGFEYVDLGLSVRWATCNVGAVSPNEFGNYYAWGETETKSIYDWASYKWCNGTENSITKYCFSSAYGNFDNKSVLETADDVANVNNGGAWRIPTKDEFKELIDNCTITELEDALKFTAKNGNSIILPFGGFAKEDGTIKSKGAYGYYWTNELSETNTYQAKDLIISETEEFDVFKVLDFYDGNRCCGLSVRPVLP